MHKTLIVYMFSFSYSTRDVKLEHEDNSKARNISTEEDELLYLHNHFVMDEVDSKSTIYQKRIKRNNTGARFKTLSCNANLSNEKKKSDEAGGYIIVDQQGKEISTKKHNRDSCNFDAFNIRRKRNGKEGNLGDIPSGDVDHRYIAIKENIDKISSQLNLYMLVQERENVKVDVHLKEPWRRLYVAVCGQNLKSSSASLHTSKQHEIFKEKIDIIPEFDNDKKERSKYKLVRYHNHVDRINKYEYLENVQIQNETAECEQNQADEKILITFEQQYLDEFIAFNAFISILLRKMALYFEKEAISYGCKFDSNKVDNTKYRNFKSRLEMLWTVVSILYIRADSFERKVSKTCSKINNMRQQCSVERMIPEEFALKIKEMDAFFIDTSENFLMGKTILELVKLRSSVEVKQFFMKPKLSKDIFSTNRIKNSLKHEEDIRFISKLPSRHLDAFMHLEKFVVAEIVKDLEMEIHYNKPVLKCILNKFIIEELLKLNKDELNKKKLIQNVADILLNSLQLERITANNDLQSGLKSDNEMTNDKCKKDIYMLLNVIQKHDLKALCQRLTTLNSSGENSDIYGKYQKILLQEYLNTDFINLSKLEMQNYKKMTTVNKQTVSTQLGSLLFQLQSNLEAKALSYRKLAFCEIIEGLKAIGVKNQTNSEIILSFILHLSTRSVDLEYKILNSIYKMNNSADESKCCSLEKSDPFNIAKNTNDVGISKSTDLKLDASNITNPEHINTNSDYLPLRLEVSIKGDKISIDHKINDKIFCGWNDISSSKFDELVINVTNSLVEIFSKFVEELYSKEVNHVISKKTLEQEDVITYLKQAEEIIIEHVKQAYINAIIESARP